MFLVISTLFLKVIFLTRLIEIRLPCLISLLISLKLSLWNNHSVSNLLKQLLVYCVIAVFSFLMISQLHYLYVIDMHIEQRKTRSYLL